MTGIPIASDNSEVSLFESFQACSTSLSDLISCLRLTNSADCDITSIEADFGRLRTWASSIGAHREGPASIDHRLQQSSGISNGVSVILTDIAGSARKIHRLEIDPSRIPYDKQTFDDSSSDESISEIIAKQAKSRIRFVPLAQSEVQKHCSSIRKAVSNLYTLSSVLLNPAPENKYLKFKRHGGTLQQDIFKEGEEGEYEPAPAELALVDGSARDRFTSVYNEEQPQLAKRLKERFTTKLEPSSDLSVHNEHSTSDKNSQDGGLFSQSNEASSGNTISTWEDGRYNSSESYQTDDKIEPLVWEPRDEIQPWVEPIPKDSQTIREEPEIKVEEKEEEELEEDDNVENEFVGNEFAEDEGDVNIESFGTEFNVQLRYQGIEQIIDMGSIFTNEQSEQWMEENSESDDVDRAQNATDTRFVPSHFGPARIWNEQLSYPINTTEEDGLSPSTHSVRKRTSRSKKCTDTEHLKNSKSSKGRSSASQKPQQYITAPEDHGLSFVFIVNELEVNEDLRNGGIAPSYEDGRWVPPVFARGFYRQTAGKIYRWDNGSICRLRHYSWFDEAIGADHSNEAAGGIVVNPYGHALTRYRTATVFYTNPFMMFQTALGDASARDIYKSGEVWHHLRFYHAGPDRCISLLDHAGNEDYLAGSNANSPWRKQIIPQEYECQETIQESSGLAGLLPLLIALIAFSCPPGELDDVLRRDSCWRNRNWVCHDRKTGRREKRGMVVTVYLDPENPEGSTFKNLRQFEMADDGRPILRPGIFGD